MSKASQKSRQNLNKCNSWQRRNQWQIAYPEMRLIPLVPPSYMMPTQLSEVVLSHYSSVPTHMHTYLLFFVSIYKATLLDSLFFSIKREMEINSKALILTSTVQIWSVHHEITGSFLIYFLKASKYTQNTYLIHVELRLPSWQLSVTCCEFSNEIMTILKKKSNQMHSIY